MGEVKKSFFFNGQAAALEEDVNGEFVYVERIKNKEIETVDVEETPTDTYRSLTTIMRADGNSYNILTPNACIVIARCFSGQYASKGLKLFYTTIINGIAKELKTKTGAENEKIKLVLENLIKRWQMVLRKRNRWIYLQNIYNTVFMPAFEGAGKAIEIPIFNAYLFDNVFSHISAKISEHFYREEKRTEKQIKKAADKAAEELNKISAAAYNYMQGNKLHEFIKGVHKTDFNVVTPIEIGTIGETEIIVPEGTFEIGKKVAGFRHPVMLGATIFTVVGFSKDHTIKVCESQFQRYMMDSDGDFFLINELVYKLIESLS